MEKVKAKLISGKEKKKEIKEHRQSVIENMKTDIPKFPDPLP
jgi:hypothetical protein